MSDSTLPNLCIVVGYFGEDGHLLNLCGLCQGAGNFKGECDSCDHECERRCTVCKGSPRYFEITKPEDGPPNWVDTPDADVAFCVMAKGRPMRGRLAYENAFAAFKALEVIQKDAALHRVLFGRAAA